MSLGSTGANILGLFQGDPTFRTLHNVKNPAIQGDINSLLGDWSATRTAGQDTLGAYIQKYLASTKDASARGAQEIGVIDPFFNGGMANTLANLRARRSQAVNAAADLGADQGIAAAKGSLLAGDGGGSSYADRLMMRAVQPYRVNAAVDNANQERSDLGYLTSAQLGLTGQRQSIEDSINNRMLVPDQLRRQMLSQNEGALNNVEQMDLANNFYGVQKKTTDLDKWINFLNSQQSTMNNDLSTLASVYGSVSGGRGGGGGSSL